MISAIICTYNRAARLENALASLRDAGVPDGPRWEVVVVDNNSSDATPDVVARFAALAPFPVRYVFEGRQGLSSARNRGVAAAQGDILAFTDDDCIVDCGWISGIASEFHADASLMLLGGRVELFNPAHPKVAIRTETVRRDLTGTLAALEYLPGCNFAFRRIAYERAGPFDLRFGAGSGIVPSGEDTDFIYRVSRTGGRLLYTPDILVRHDHGRTSDTAVQALRRAYAEGRGAFYAKHMLRCDAAVTRAAWWEVSGLVRSLFRDGSAAECGRVLLALAAGATAVFLRRSSARSPDQAAK